MSAGTARIRRLGLLALPLGALLGLAAPAVATPIAWWRMEVDADPTPEGLRVASDVAGASDLVSSEAFLDTANIPGVTVPLTGDGNTSSVGATRQGGGNGINATAAAWLGLDVASFGVEFWARTQESTATLFQRSTGGSDGIVIDNPNALTVTWFVDDPLGGVTQLQLTGLDDLDTSWSHYAFSYDAATGVGSFFVDGSEVASIDGPDNAPLLWDSSTPVEVGLLMDFAAANFGTMDEVRLHDTSLAPSDFLSSVPEPGAALLLAFTGLALAGRRPRAWR